jgi:glycosyltransferase involved in cell wall biosynthesis
MPLEKYRQFGVIDRGRIPRHELAVEIMNARVMLYPGHRNETFCFAAAEATAAGLPIVTRGIGSLTERVSDGENGFIAWEPADYAAHATRLLLDDELWLAMHRKILMNRDLPSWDDRVGEWTKAFLE